MGWQAVAAIGSLGLGVYSDKRKRDRAQFQRARLEEQLFPEGPPGVPTAEEIEFDPTLLLKGLEYYERMIDEGINYAEPRFRRGLDYAQGQYGNAIGIQAPFYNNAAGFGALSNAVLSGQFDPRNNANAFQSGPGMPEYEFRLERGIDAIDKAASAKGLLGSGSRMKDLAAFGQGLSSTFSTEDMNRRLAVSGANMGSLSQLANYEQASANNISNLFSNLGGIGEANYRGLGSLGLNALAGLGSTGANVYGQAGELQNRVAMANAANSLAAQTSAYNAYANLLSGGQGQQGGSTLGTLLGTFASMAPFIFGGSGTTSSGAGMG